MSSLLNQAINIITTTIASAKEAKRKGEGGGGSYRHSSRAELYEWQDEIIAYIKLS